MGGKENQQHLSHGTPDTPQPRVFPEIELGDPSEYQYIEREEVSRVLGEEFNYGPSKRLVDELYLSPDGKIAVGVLRVTEEICEGHFEGNPLMRGVDQVEAAAQTHLLRLRFSGELPQGQSPRFGAIEEFTFKNPAVPGMDLNIIAVAAPEGGLNGFARIATGANNGKVISEGFVSGSFMPDALSTRMLDRARRQITPPLFPRKGK